MIGDPSGRSKTRVPLTFDETRRNGQTYLEQVTKILDREKTTVAYNSQWLGRMNFADVLSLAGKYTLARVMERDDFAKRFTENQPVGLHELFYPLMQGYDSVALSADIEVGGTDQTFNLLVGRELQRDYAQEPQAVITFPLLIGLDGTEKMSKSLDNTIGLDEPPALMFEKCMRVPDTLLVDYFRLTTDVPAGTYEQLIASDIREAHFVFAREIVAMYHSQDAAASAKSRYREVASGGRPENIETLELPHKEIGIVELLKSAGFAESNSDARRLISGGGIKLDGVTVTDSGIMLRGEREIILSRGKNRFLRVVFTKAGVSV